ncbi:hypothetical protein ACHAAC_16785 [Aeromicrobium sp. CF4.19]|uniref:hypothetical protein n=1 Tax=Aeromicrobium sp. CF4.19 TaxID=3373082 RepID=UPI003EE5E26C
MSETLHVLLFADPGLPSRQATAIEDGLREDLESWFGRTVDLDVRRQSLLLLQDNTLELDAVARRAAQTEPDVTVVLTEIPRHSGGRPLVCELRPDLRVAVISCPTLGIVRTRRRLRRLVLASVARSLPDVPGREVESLDDRGTEWTESDHHGGSFVLLAPASTGIPRLVLGMTAANEPLRTAPRLSSAMAAATAVGAFGIFYSSIWQMAAALSTPRLVLIGLGAIVSMTAWLVLSNGLWDRSRLEPMRRVVGLYNVSTLLTLFLCVTGLYAVLVVVILLASAIVIEPGFMGTVLGFEASAANYLAIAWLSAAMGVVAGALGASFDADTDVRRLTHGQRERQRFHDPSEDAEAESA